MKCTSCAAENPAGARFCIQCGAEQALPTPIAAVAAAVSGQRGRAAVAHAANAAQADPTHEYDAEPRRRAAQLPADDPREPTVRHEPRARATGRLAPATPAYALAPSRGRLAAFLIVLAFAVAALALGAWNMFGGEPRSDSGLRAPDRSVMSSFPPEATPSPRRPAEAASQPAAPPAPSVAAAEAPREGEGKPPGETPAAATDARGAAAPTIEIRSLPAKPAARPTHRRAPEKAQHAPPAPAAEAPVPTPAPARAPEVVAAKPPAPPVVDRWTRMADELSRCTREDFISRVICDQRVRFRYCNGYWGRLPQCPGSPAPERGQ